MLVFSICDAIKVYKHQRAGDRPEKILLRPHLQWIYFIDS